jgi:hypothetical protein
LGTPNPSNFLDVTRGLSDVEHKADVLKASPDVRFWAQCEYLKPIPLIASSPRHSARNARHRTICRDETPDEWVASIGRDIAANKPDGVQSRLAEPSRKARGFQYRIRS